MDISPASTSRLSSLPPEILHLIFYFSTTPTFLQLVRTNRQFFSLASQSREVILHHLRRVPGLKLGLDDVCLSTSELFLILRQRAAAHLYGANFTADCRSFGIQPHPGRGDALDCRASCLAQSDDGRNVISLVLEGSSKVRRYSRSGRNRGPIDAPYLDGRSRIVQVVQKDSTISILYINEWTPPPGTNPTKGEEAVTAPSEATFKKTSLQDLQEEDDDPEGRRSAKRRAQEPASRPPSSSFVRYFLLHYNANNVADRPIFFSIPTHKSLHKKFLVPVHLAVHNRLQCAILWDVPDTALPTNQASLVLYLASSLPRDEPGVYDAFVIYPFDHPAPIRLVGERINVNDERTTDRASDQRLYTCTKRYANPTDRGDLDLRLLHAGLKPRAVSFFKDGRRIFLYAPGSITPYTTLLANETLRTQSPRYSNFNLWDGSVGVMRRLHTRVRRTNTTSIYNHRFTLSLPFFSQHGIAIPRALPGSDNEVPEIECVSNILCLGTTQIARHSGGPQILTIVQVRRRVPHSMCPHIDLTDDLPILPAPPPNRRRRSPSYYNEDDETDTDDESTHSEDDTIFASVHDDLDREALNGTDLRVVARLWGWNPHTTNLTGQETVSVSPRGERIAIAQWDRVLVYALDPGALCEDLVGREESLVDDETVSLVGSSDVSHDGSGIGSGGGGSVGEPEIIQLQPEVFDGEDTPATFSTIQLPSANPTHPPAPPSLVSTTSTSPLRLLNFYPRVDDKLLGGWVVELRPVVVLKMDDGAVVRKMIWGHGRPIRQGENGERFDEDEDEDSDRGEAMGGQADWSRRGRRNTNESEKGKSKEKQKGKDEAEFGVSMDKMDGVIASKEQQGQYEAAERHDQICAPDEASMQHEPCQESNQVGSKASSGLKPDRPKQQRPKSPSLDESLPPAPFSDMKLTGQIKHIARPSEYHHYTLKFVPGFAGPPSTLSSIPSEPPNSDKEEQQGLHEAEEHPDGEREESPALGPLQPRASSPPAETETEQAAGSKLDIERKRYKRDPEDELIILTDRGVQIWDLGVWGKGRRIRCALDEDDVLQ